MNACKYPPKNEVPKKNQVDCVWMPYDKKNKKTKNVWLGPLG